MPGHSPFPLPGAQLPASARDVGRLPGGGLASPSPVPFSPQPARGALDLDQLHGKDAHGCNQLPPHPGVRHDEPGQGLCHRAPGLLWAQEHLHPLHVRAAPPLTRHKPLQICFPKAQVYLPQTHTHRFKRKAREGSQEGHVGSGPMAPRGRPAAFPSVRRDPFSGG